MTAKQPVTLTVFLESAEHRWFVAGIDHEGTVTPLVCSEPGDLAGYVGQQFEEQVSFLRHRLSGVLQRGCDRLWGRAQKPCQVVFAADDLFPSAAPELTQRVAEHFAEWMTRPPVTFLMLRDGTADVEQLAGDWIAESRAACQSGLADLRSACAQETNWELIPTKRTKKVD